MTQQGDEEYLTVEEAMRYLRVSRATLERFAKAGELKKYRRPGVREVHFKKSELDELKRFRPLE